MESWTSSNFGTQVKWPQKGCETCGRAWPICAAVRSFQLFVTTTFDSLLRRALNDVRYGGDDVTNVLAFRSTQTDDVPEPAPKAAAGAR